MRLRFFWLIPLLLVAACAGKNDEEKYEEKPVDVLYNDAMTDLTRHRFEKAAKQFDEVERQHPYSVWATKAQLMAAYAKYQQRAYDESVIAIDRFLQLHPGNRDTPYAYYLKGLDYFEQIEDTGRDQTATENALVAFQELIRRYPNSNYARDARLKIDLVNDHLAGKEMEVGRFYEVEKQYIAAINRFRQIVDNYQTTSQAPEALARLTECYLALGLTREAQESAAVLGHNYPNSVWYGDAYGAMQKQAAKDGSNLPKPGETTASADLELQKPTQQPGWFGRNIPWL